jgi:hypothetical protein
MATGNATLANISALTGSAPDHHRTAGEGQPMLNMAAKAADVSAQGDAPSVTISASAIAITVGDKLLGTIIGPDVNGNRHFVAAQGVFSVDPQAALEGLTNAVFRVTSTGRGIEAVLLPTNLETSAANVPVKLQLVQANIAQLSTLLNMQDVAASDTPLTLALQIANALQEFGQPLPLGFTLTPKVAFTVQPLAATLLNLAKPNTTQASAQPGTTLPTAIADSPFASLEATLVKVGLPAMLPSALQIIVQQPSLAGAAPLEHAMSLLADLPDSHDSRAMILQSPLLGQLLKSGRLIILQTPIVPQTLAHILKSASLAPMDVPETQRIAVTLLDIDARPLPLPSGRLLLLLDTAASKLPPQPVNIDISAQLLLAPEENILWRALQAGLTERAATPNSTIETIPGLKASLAADILLLFNALSRKLPSSTLDKLVQARYSGGDSNVSVSNAIERPVLLETMARLAHGITKNAATTDSPLRLVVPLYIGSQVLPLMFVFTPPPETHHSTEQDANSGPQDDDEQLFALAIDFPQLGPLTIRGRCAFRRLSLAVETHTALPELLQSSARSIFIDTLEAAGMAGQLNFMSLSDRGWQSPALAL